MADTSTFSQTEGSEADLAADNDVETCMNIPRTKKIDGEGKIWWMTNLKEPSQIHTIVMKTGVSFGCKDYDVLCY